MNKLNKKQYETALDAHRILTSAIESLVTTSKHITNKDVMNQVGQAITGLESELFAHSKVMAAADAMANNFNPKLIAHAFDRLRVINDLIRLNKDFISTKQRYYDHKCQEAMALRIQPELHKPLDVAPTQEDHSRVDAERVQLENELEIINQLLRDGHLFDMRPGHALRFLYPLKSMQDKRDIAVLKTLGARMREARHLCGDSPTSPMALAHAAKMLGCDALFLGNLEQGVDTEHTPLWLLKKASEVYDVSLDFLFGFSDDWERDPSTCFERRTGRGLHDFYMQELSKAIVDYQKCQARQDTLTHVVVKLLPLVGGVFESVESFRRANRGFSEMPVGSQILHRARIAHQCANEARHQLIHAKVIPAPDGNKSKTGCNPRTS